MDIAELRKVAEAYAKGQRLIETVDPHAVLELIAEIERKDKTIAALSGLFEKFMLHVYKCEGRNFVCDIDDSSEIKFTPEEVKALEAMSERVFWIKPN